MMQLRFAHKCLLGLAVGASAASLALWKAGSFSGDASGVSSGWTNVAPKFGITKEIISSQLGAKIKQGLFPEQADLELDGVRTRGVFEYGLLADEQSKMVKLFDSYKPDYGAFVAMDARTGRILSLVSYSRENEGLDNLALQASFPAASVFKVVTASAAIDSKKATPDTIVPFNGANHTLYRRNVQDSRVNRWTRKMTMREAFARSVNTVFSKLGLFYVGPENLLEYAQRFQFNRQIRADIPVEPGYAKIERDDPWSVATAASGFTRDNTMSPLQGALIAAAIANDGVMMEPYLIESIQNAVDGAPMYVAEPREASVALDPRAAAELRVLMRETVRNGTSRKWFRQALRSRSLEGVEFGGKTGSLTGLNPAGKCDWFVGYARYHGERIAVAALTVNEKKWRVKSSRIASEFFSNHLRAEIARDRVAQNLRLPADSAR